MLDIDKREFTIKHFIGVLAFFYLFCAMPNTVLAAEKPNHPQAKKLRIGYDERPPNQYTNKDGKAVGADIVYISRLLDAANIEYEFFSYPWKRILRFVQTGQLDVAMAAAKIEERQAFAYFSEEVFTRGDNVLLVHEKYREVFSQFSSLEDLTSIPHKVAVTRGSSYSDEYDLLLSSFAFTERLIQVNSIDQAVNLVLSERIAGFITFFAQAQYELTKRCQQEQFFIAYSLLEHENDAAYLMYSKETVGLDIVSAIDKVMKKIKRLPVDNKFEHSPCSAS